MTQMKFKWEVGCDDLGRRWENFASCWLLLKLPHRWNKKQEISTEASALVHLILAWLSKYSVGSNSRDETVYWYHNITWWLSSGMYYFMSCYTRSMYKPPLSPSKGENSITINGITSSRESFIFYRDITVNSAHISLWWFFSNFNPLLLISLTMPVFKAITPLSTQT